jgi:GWxTD domain-containing protein
MIHRVLSILTLCAAVYAGQMLSCSGASRTPASEEFYGFLAAGDTASAVERIDKINLRRQRNPSIYVLAGRLYRELGTVNGRLLSQRVLERGLSRFPRDPQLLTELGKTYFAQTFYPDALRCFRSALEQDPSLCEAHYYIGLYYYNNWKRVNQYTDDLTASRRHFAAAIQCDSTDLESTIKLAFALYALDRREEAAEVVASALGRFSSAPEFHLLRGAMAYDDDRFEDADADFRAGLRLMDEDLRLEYLDLFSLLPYDERFLYDDSQQNKRVVVERGYWIDHDPDPTTAINERWLEHIYRMFIADLYFSCYRPPIRGWRTERGATVVKFGWPWHIQSTLAGSQFSGRTEEWHYITKHNKLRRFVFVDEYLSGNLRIPIEADSMIVVLRYDPAISSYFPEAETLPGVINVSAFKDDEFSCTYYIAAAVDAVALRETVDIAKVNHFVFRGVFFDNEWNVDHRFADTLWTSEVPTEKIAGSLQYVVLRPVSLPFDMHHVACAFEDQTGAVRASLKGVGDSYRFSNTELCVSDLLLQNDPHPGAASIARKGKQLYPNAERLYSTGQKLVVYFELYNLGTSRRRTDYDVTFLIYDSPENPPSRWWRLGRSIAQFTGLVGDRDPAISQTIRRRGVEHTSNEDMTVNIDALEAGRYELVVSVADRVTGENAYSTAIFFKE